MGDIFYCGVDINCFAGGDVLARGAPPFQQLTMQTEWCDVCGEGANTEHKNANQHVAV